MEASLQNAKFVNILPPAAINDNAAYTVTAVDCRGFSRLTVVVQLGALDIAVVSLKLTEADDDSNYSDVTGAVFGTSTNIAGSTSALPSASADNNLYCFDVDLRGRKRYVKLAFTAGDGASGTYASALAILSHPENSLDTATKRGFGDVLRV